MESYVKVAPGHWTSGGLVVINDKRVANRIMFSKTFGYGIRAVTFLASREDTGFVKVHDLSQRLGVSQSMLAKVLHRLQAAGVIETLRGPSGGCRLNPEASSLTLADLAVALDEKTPEQECLLRPGPCLGTEDCVLAQLGLAPLRSTLARISIGDIADRCGPLAVSELH